MLSREEKMNRLKELKEYGYLSHNAFNYAIENFEKINVIEIYNEFKKNNNNMPFAHQSIDPQIKKIFGKSMANKGIKENNEKETDEFNDDILNQIYIIQNIYK